MLWRSGAASFNSDAAAGFVSYQFNDLAFDTFLSAGGEGASSVVSCSNMAQRQVGSIGLDWTPGQSGSTIFEAGR